EHFAPLALHCFLGSAFRHAKPDDSGASRARLDLLDQVPAQFRPVADCLRYEVLLARKETAAAKQLRRQLEKDHPELRWRLEAIDQDRGTIATVFQEVSR